ncbi:hypothetical protein C0989_008657 [Termitomyces sp. Mn162]|nr:hypothetical protein C0989_008657 [Termitomyces sp. Mn162]
MMLQALNKTKQTVKAHAGHFMQNKFNIVVLWGMVNNLQNQLQISTSSLPPVPAPTLAPIAEAEEPNNDEAAQPKKYESQMDCATAVATTVNQSAIADNSALISNSIATVTSSGIPSRSATKSVISTGPTASITNSAIATDSVTPTGPATSIIDSTLATGPAASNESTVPTGVESVLGSPIAATGQLMDVDMTGPEAEITIAESLRDQDKKAMDILKAQTIGLQARHGGNLADTGLEAGSWMPDTNTF